MRIHYDWRMARVVDENANIVDEIVWSSKRSVGALADRLWELQSGGLSPEARTLADRFPDAQSDGLAAVSDSDWPELDDEEHEILSKASARLAKRGVANSAADPDRRLDMLSGATSELRAAWGTSEARCVEWAGLFLPDADLDRQRENIPSKVADAKSIDEAAASLDLQAPEHHPADQEWIALRAHARGVIDLAERLDLAEQATRALAQQHVPTLSLLVGPLGAAKMVTLAGGRERLARMPSGSLQVLGASGAMAAHRRGAPPPKHSPILFSLPQVSRSPRWVRGKIARYLAGKCSIAVRIDHFDGEPWGDEQIADINQECQNIKDRFPKPPKRR
ncbi:MAG: hypothetical protein CMA47_00025 [Euryarchaeota archaeon]|nr:hypothetical protein [Euryarchaeota archaeon]